jgi:cell division protein FtsI (penicillin-binding protein 3)
MGTAHGAVHLNGYSAAGKTGTAQKIDPRTHTYSKTNFVASFVGFAPVNNPAITIAVVMDSPSHSMHFGAQASAPVFQDLAQQILEYLGVPHDEPMQTPAAMAKAEQAVPDDAPPEHIDNLDSLFAEVNNLPADDPLRTSAPAPTRLPESKTEEVAHPPVPDFSASLNSPPVPPAPQTTSTASELPQGSADPPEPAAEPALPTRPPGGNGSVIVASAQRVAVPSFVGEPVRKVIEQAGGAGLGVQVLGSGIARGQAPAAGTMVPAGTEVVVRFAR